MWMISPSKGRMSLEDVVLDMKQYIEESDCPIEIVVGSDSQNTNQTKFVTVLAIRRLGQGGRFFYVVEYHKLVTNLRQKIYQETQMTLQLANELTNIMIENDILYDVIIHLDLGKYGKTKEMISEITGWVTEMGYASRIKPECWCAFAIANYLTK
ncbi:MAG: ribonuclease H-like YkuK family protein [Balneolaceae bacterium]